MAARGNSRANENRRIRQEALREQLEQQGHHQHIIDLLEKLQDLDEELEATQIQRLKIVIESKFKMLAKYIPDLKQQEIDMVMDGRITLDRQVQRLDGSTDAETG